MTNFGLCYFGTTQLLYLVDLKSQSHGMSLEGNFIDIIIGVG